MDEFPTRNSTSTSTFCSVVCRNCSLIFHHRPNSFFSSNATKISVILSPFQCPPAVEPCLFPDFSLVSQIQKNRQQLQGYDVTLKRIEEIDVATIVSSNPNIPIDMKIFDNIREEIFCYTVGQMSTIPVEFVHRDAMKRWLAKRDELETEFNVKIRPKIHFNDQQETSRSAHIGELTQEDTLKTTTRQQTQETRTVEPVRGAVPTVETTVVSFFLRSPSQTALFAKKIIEEGSFSFIERTFHVQTEITPSSNANERMVKISGVKSATEPALKYLLSFPSICRTKLYDHAISKKNSI